jgi:hypothetical protein
MGAHVLRGLNNVATMADTDFTWSLLECAVQRSCWTEDLTLEDWRLLRDIVARRDYAGLQEFVGAVTQTYARTWEALGRPATREEWNRAEIREVARKRAEMESKLTDFWAELESV